MNYIYKNDLRPYFLLNFLGFRSCLFMIQSFMKKYSKIMTPS